MKNELILSILLIAFTVLLLNPFEFFMPGKLLMVLIGLLVATTALFAGLIWKEKAQDEREMQHKMIAGRGAFAIGTSILVIGIAVQSWTHSVDPWLVIALVAMILAKISMRIYAEKTL